MSLYDKLFYASQLESTKNTKITTNNVEIETKFYKTSGIGELIDHFGEKQEINKSTGYSKNVTVDYLHAKKSSKKSDKK